MDPKWPITEPEKEPLEWRSTLTSNSMGASQISQEKANYQNGKRFASAVLWEQKSLVWETKWLVSTFCSKHHQSKPSLRGEDASLDNAPIIRTKLYMFRIDPHPQDSIRVQWMQTRYVIQSEMEFQTQWNQRDVQ